MKKLAAARSQFEFEQIERENAELEENKIRQARLKNWLIAGLVILLMSLVLAFWALVLRNRSVKKLKQQKEAVTKLLNEKENLISKLAQAQSRLIASEKMASLGQLTAGIAHEINNPVNFITSSTEALKLDFGDLKKLLVFIFELEKSGDQKNLNKLSDLIKTTDAEFVSQEMEKLIESIERGANRTQEIVKNLRTFSRDTSEAFLEADIHEGLDSAINILNHKIKGRIALHRKYAELQPIPCQISRLNQVFLNILDNAIQAVDDTGEIFVSTEQQNEHVIVRIRDTGRGMDEETQAHIFEPFFHDQECW